MKTLFTSNAPEPFALTITWLDRALAVFLVLTLISAPVAALASWLLRLNQNLTGIILSAGLALAAACLILLLVRFRSQSSPSLLRSLREESRHIGAELRELQGSLDQLRQHRQVIDAELHTQIEILKPGYREKNADLNALLINIDERERDEISAALQTYQDAYLRTTIADASIRRVSVPGFTDQVLEKLEDAGILTAVDITPERLKAIPDLGPFLIQELDLWRQRIETEAMWHKPLALPSTRLDPIRARYQEERMAIKASMEGLVYGMQNAVTEIEYGVGERLVQANAFQDDLTRRVAELKNDLQEINERVGSLEGLTFVHYFRRCLWLSKKKGLS